MAASEPVVVAVAGDAVEAAIWVDALRAAGVEASSFERSEGAAMGGAVLSGWATYPVLVRRERLAAARSVVSELAGGAVLAPLPDEQWERDARRKAVLVAGAIVAGVLALAVAARVLVG